MAKKEYGEYRVVKRTFEGKQDDAATSSYMRSYKYCVKGPNISATYKTKREAIEAAKRMAANKE